MADRAVRKTGKDRDGDITALCSDGDHRQVPPDGSRQHIPQQLGRPARLLTAGPPLLLRQGEQRHAASVRIDL
jgi:hypothetical protein